MEKVSWTEFKELDTYRQTVLLMMYRRVRKLEELRWKFSLFAVINDNKQMMNIQQEYNKLFGHEKSAIQEALETFARMKNKRIMVNPMTPAIGRPSISEIQKFGRGVVM